MLSVAMSSQHEDDEDNYDDNDDASMGSASSTAEEEDEDEEPAFPQTAKSDHFDIGALAQRLKTEVERDLADETLDVQELANRMAAQQQTLMAHAAKVHSLPTSSKP
jgi:hypothetical protein